MSSVRMSTMFGFCSAALAIPASANKPETMIVFMPGCTSSLRLSLWLDDSLLQLPFTFS